MNEDELRKLVTVQISSDHLLAELLIAPGVTHSELTEVFLQSILDERSIQTSIQSSTAIKEVIESHAENPDKPLKATVATGTPAVDGIDGGIELDEKVQAQLDQINHNKKDASEEDAETIDFYSQSSFVIVTKGQLLGRIIPPAPGTDGTDVCGKSIPAKPGRACPIALENCDLKQDQAIMAKSAGALSLTKTSLRIDAILEISKYVDFSTGNVDFPGSVTIQKGVRDNFIVKAGETIQVFGLVEAATLCAAKDVILSQGMAAKEKGSITTGRNLEAKYIDNVECQIQTNLCIQKEINNCNPTVAGEILSSTCRLIGGETRVAGTCELGQIGSDAGTPTFLHIGCHPELETLIEQAHSLYPLVLAQANHAQTELAQLTAAMGKLTPTQAERLTELQFELSEHQNRVNEVAKAVALLCELHQSKTHIELRVTKKIYPRVELCMNTVRVTFKESVPGPLCIQLRDNGKPEILDVASGNTQLLSEVASVATDPDLPDLKAIHQECLILDKNKQSEAA